MALQQQVSLRPLNTFGVDATARYLVTARSVNELLDELARPELEDLPRLLLGGGSNFLFVEEWVGVVIRFDATGIDIVGEDADTVLIRAAAGEGWHGFVRQTIAMGHAGLENLSLIPGTVGAAPVQNIGAYGVELAQRFHSLEVLDLDSGSIAVMDRDACRFGYRDSWFKQQPAGRHLITSITVALPKKPDWVLDYGDLARAVEVRAEGEISAALISDVVSEIRRRKLPDPATLGNAGSFFKNPVVATVEAERLREHHPDLPLFRADQGYKLPAAWLIERCGWKGRRIGDAGVAVGHALVLVNHGAASGAEIWALAQRIIDDVGERFGVLLEPEPRIPGVNCYCAKK